MTQVALSQYGFLQPEGYLAASEDEAAAFAANIGYPVVLKISSPDILHKTDVGGVELGLDSENGVRAGYRRILDSVAGRLPEARLDGVWVEEMLAGGSEVIIGLKRDAQFGPVIMFGLGGILTELLDDVSFRVLPITEEDAGQMIAEIRGARVLEGYRGSAPVSPAALIDLLMQAGHLGLDLGDSLESVDLNPVLVWGDQHRVLDAKIVVAAPAGGAEPAGSGAAATGKPPAGGASGGGAATLPGAAAPRPPDTSYIDTFFKARSVALVGASSTPGKIGHAVLDSLANHEYHGEIFPVNPGKESILGLQAYPTLSDIPRPVDLVVCTVDLALVPDLLHECAARQVHNLVIVSGGGKELGGERAALEAEIRRLARELAIRVIGPNCIGVLDGSTRLDTFFQPQTRMLRPPAGPVAMLSQSGTVGISFLEDAVPFGVSKFVSYGNRVDVDEADLIAYLADDPDTSVIALYVEGFEDGRRFLDTARAVSTRKPVVIFKSGRTAPAGRAALTHTGFLAGSYKVAEGAFRQAGLIPVDSYEELVAVSKVLALQPRAAGNRVAMIGNGIGTIVQALDLLGTGGLSLAALAQSTLRHLAGIFPPFYVVQNPLDVTGSGTSSDYEVGIEALLADPGVDIVMPWFVFQDVPLGEDIPEKLDRVNRKATKPIVAAAMGGPFTQRLSREIESRGIPVLHSVRDWVAAARGLVPPRAGA